MTICERVTSVDVAGTRIAFCEQGRGPHLVLLHGMFGDHLDWEPVIDPLSSQFHVVAVDLPGFGASGKPSTEYSADFFLKALHGLFAALEMDRIFLVGHSFGGQLAILFSLRYPKLVRKLVLVDSGGFRQIPGEERMQTLNAFSESNLRNMNWVAIQYLFAPAFAHDSTEKMRYLDRQTSRLNTPDYREYTHAIAQAIRLSLTTYLLNELSELHCPTLLIWGESDRLCPVEQARTGLKQLRAGELHVLHGCGHMPQLDSPREFVGLVSRFLTAEESN